MKGSKEISHKEKHIQRTYKGKFHYLRLLVNSFFPLICLNSLFYFVNWTWILVLNQIPFLWFVIHHIRIVLSRNRDVTEFLFPKIFYYENSNTKLCDIQATKIKSFNHICKNYEQNKVSIPSGFFRIFKFALILEGKKPARWKKSCQLQDFVF